MAPLLTDDGEVDLIYYDLETTGLPETSHITQIAAVDSDGNTWSTYVLPQQPIHPKASQVTGLTMVDGKLTRNGAMVHTIGIREALTHFFSFIEARNRPAVLVGHNIINFDNRILLNAAGNVGLTDHLRRVVNQCIDSLRMFRAVLPYEHSHSLPSLISSRLQTSYDAHNAIDDVKVLQQLVNQECTDEALRRQLVRFA